MISTPYQFPAGGGTGAQPVTNAEATAQTEKVEAAAQPEAATPAKEQPAPAAAAPGFFEQYKWVLLIVAVLAAAFFFWKYKIVPKVPAIV